MANNKVSSRTVKEAFLLANAGRLLFERKQIKSKRALEDAYQRLAAKISDLDAHELDHKITDKIKLSRYDRFDWHVGRFPFKNIGPWPEMDGLDIRLTTGNILDTAKAVKDAASGKMILSYADKTESEKRAKNFSRFLEKSASIRNNLDFIYRKFPLILLPGGEVREKDYNTWARKNNAPLCRVFKFDLQDGNDRAVSYALENIADAPCFYGLSKD